MTKWHGGISIKPPYVKYTFIAGYFKLIFRDRKKTKKGLKDRNFQNIPQATE